MTAIMTTDPVRNISPLPHSDFEPLHEPVEQSPDQESPSREPGPVHRQDKETVRAKIDSFREVANLSARSAVVPYASKTLQRKMLLVGRVVQHWCLTADG